MTQATTNLLALYERNPAADADIGWYADAKQLGKRRARAIGLPWHTYAAVTAATSPMQQWATKDGRYPNFDAAERVIRWHRGQMDSPRTLGANARNGAAILDGADPADILGPKTRRFWMALLGDPDTVVLDRWALRAIGWPRESIAEREYDAAAAAYIEAAELLRISPAAVQAATWTQIKRESEGR